MGTHTFVPDRETQLLGLIEIAKLKIQCYQIRISSGWYLSQTVRVNGGRKLTNLELLDDHLAHIDTQIQGITECYDELANLRAN